MNRLINEIVLEDCVTFEQTGKKKMQLLINNSVKWMSLNYHEEWLFIILKKECFSSVKNKIRNEITIRYWNDLQCNAKMAVPYSARGHFMPIDPLARNDTSKCGRRK